VGKGAERRAHASGAGGYETAWASLRSPTLQNTILFATTGPEPMARRMVAYPCTLC